MGSSAGPCKFRTLASVCRDSFGATNMTLRRRRYSLGELSLVLVVLMCVGASCYGAVISSESHYYDGQETSGFTEKLQVRLTGGINPFEGRVLVHSEGRWRAVCDREWGIPDADVICRQLGFGYSSMAWRGAHFGEEPSEAVDDFRIILSCLGKEATFSECSHRKISAVSCGKFKTAGVRCSNISSQKDNSIRLVGGITPNSGQVQLYHNRTWNVICDESWDMIKAAVACRELGYPSVTADWGQSLLDVGDDDPQQAVQLLSCTGAENKVAECKVGALLGSRCRNPVSVTCVTAERNGSPRDRLRLTGGTHPNMGRVEVNIDGNWGTICDEDWDLKDARVVCKELGFHYATAAPRGAHFGEGTGAVLFSRVGCTGHERHLLECARSGFEATNCQHGHDAGVVCSVDPTAEPAGNLMRLSDSSSGFVEVFHDGQWWRVCGQGWDTNDASVACRQLGYRHPSKTIISPVLTAASPVKSIDARGDIGVLLNKMRCHGNETNLAFCQHGGLGPQVCATRSGHAVADCNGNMPRRSNGIGKVRLASGKSNYEGRVEIFLDGAWATVCADRWDMADAKVVCRQLGFTHATSALVSAAHFGPGSGPIVLDEVECVGDEDNLLDCRAERLYQHDCQHRQDAGVRCDNRTVSYDYSVRLTGGSTSNAGRVEILLNSIWHTVCDDANSWNVRGANVVCRELGFSRASQPWAKTSGALEKGKRSFATVKCMGNETTIAGCQYGGVGDVDCGGVKHEARVLCEHRPKEPPYRIRLDGGSTPREGIVQILQDEHWFPVCGDGWDIADALVVCKQRGYQFAKSATSIQERRGVAEAQQVMTNRAHQLKMVLQQVRGWSGFRCTGHEDHLLECEHTESRTFGCGRGEIIKVAHVECSEKPSIPAGERLRLSGNSKENEGRVEVYYEGMWWKICADDWDMPDASVVCRQIGYPSALVPYKLSNDSAKDDFCERDLSGIDAAEDSNCRLNYLMGDLQCMGKEGSVVDCRHAGFGRQYCSQNHDAGVVCNGKRIKPTFEARLGGSDRSHPYEGRVELQHDGRWWLVCNEGWDYTDAQVLCRQLGFPGAESDPTLQTFYKGRRTVEMGFLVEDVDCLGTEDNLAECLNGGVGKATCQTQVAVGVRCSTDLLMIEGPDIRLIGGESLQEGRVELYHDNRWWTICDDNWDISAAEVACKQLGFPAAESAVLGAYFGKGREDMGILLDEVNCRGSEDNLLVCSHHTVGEHDCKHTQDAGVRCSKPTVQHSMKLPKSIRLTGSNTTSEGVVELYHNYRWWTVCRTGNLSDDLNSAIIVCRQLEFSTAQGVIPAGNFTLPPRYTRALLSGLRCEGTERNLTLCRHDGLEVAVGKQCDRTQSLAVRCTPSKPLNSPDSSPSRKRKRTGPTTPVLAVIIATVFVTGFLIGSLILYHVYQACDRFLSRQRTSSSDNSPPATNVTTSNTDSAGRGNQGRGRSRSRGDSESTRNKDMFIELYPLPPAPDPVEESETEVDGDGDEYGDWTGAPVVQRENSIPPPNTPDAAFDGTLV